MARRILIIAAIIIVALVLFEALKLLELRSSIDRYASYWKDQATEDGAFVYVVVGDSAAQGIGASAPQFGYVGLLTHNIADATGKTVKVVNLSVSGATVQDAIDRQLPKLKKLKPDLVTVEIGANNIRNWDQKTFQQQYNELAQKLPKDSIVANVPYFGGRIHANAATTQANTIIAEAATRYDLTLVDLHSYTASHNSWRNYAADWFHPNNRGYRVWADAFWPVIRGELER